ncbi:low molecular weight protein-tyrosine-phosphatase [Solitalea koreensis]|uniref:protein-tyrosine-phosphatase n=1 Tax=Solitalea koreensis TaxID=543615 RepID=A0A521BYH8_9SPHI|nr:low molecular weight protein-tyrosine-phosphatase [Solitalea koreensis]SMO52248.1 protein tyrosine phosphatase [Solitalea koreensis]
MKILMVCLGNICRSPMAEGIMRDLVKKSNLDWQVDSCGTGSWHIGEPPHKVAQLTAKKFGTDISDLRARQFHPGDFDAFDKILVMDQSNYADVMVQARSEKDREKVDLILNLTLPGRNCEVADPWFDNTMFDAVYKQLEQACQQFVTTELGIVNEDAAKE